MSQITRHTSSDDDWASDLPEPASPTKPVTEFERAQAWAGAVGRLGDLVEATRALATDVVSGTTLHLDRLDPGPPIVLAAKLQDLRRELAQIEAWIVRQVGQSELTQRKGTLADGRLYEVRKADTRKAWDHPGWQRDVRAQVMSGIPAVAVDPETGDTFNPADMLAAIQAVHGAGAPKVTALKALGLTPGDYSENVPGPWTLQVSAPETTAKD